MLKAANDFYDNVTKCFHKEGYKKTGIDNPIPLLDRYSNCLISKCIINLSRLSYFTRSRINMPVAVIYIAAAMLFIGAAPLPYGYYMLLRLVATGVFIWAAFIAYERNNEALPWVYGVLSLLFNPLIKIHLPKELWAVVDVGLGVLLLATKSAIQKKV